jgi:NADH-quinone oxidoreductase subunit M
MLTLSLFIIPLIAGLVLLNIKNKGLASSISLVVSIIQIAVFVYAFSVFKDKSALLTFDKPWLSDFAIRFHLGLDALSLIMVGLTVVLVSIIFRIGFGASLSYC